MEAYSVFVMEVFRERFIAAELLSYKEVLFEEGNGQKRGCLTDWKCITIYLHNCDVTKRIRRHLQVSTETFKVIY